MSQQPIAIIGLTCRFPDAPDAETFWDNLTKGREAVRPLSLEEMQRQRIDSALPSVPGYVNAGTFIEGAECFDIGYFGYSPREAELMDPQHRLFLQECRRLMDLSNLTGSGLSIGAFAGCRQSTYQPLLAPIRAEMITHTESFQQLMGNDKDYLVTRVAYKLNLTGPAMTIQTACSSSLVAVHQACESLINGECDAALAGGVAISFPQGIGYIGQPGMIFSQDGHCRPFSAEGTGIVAGNGLGLVALKRLSDARAAGDVIHAVILGSGITNDGNTKIGYTAPGKEGQQRAIRHALKKSGIAPAEIGMFEAHGTGTPLGDPIEVQAISEIYRAEGGDAQRCAIGSVKGNIGHLDTAAGVASLIKAALAVRTGAIPATLHARPLNPRIDFERSPFYPASETTPWPEHFSRRLAAVSSFGIGGTNCHMIVAEPPTSGNSAAEGLSQQVLVLSNHDVANMPAAVSAISGRLASTALTAQCATAALRRQHLGYRIAVTGVDVADLTAALAQAQPAEVKPAARTAWMFSGQGSQFSGMGAELHRSNAVFRGALDRCSTAFAQNGIADLESAMFETARAADLNRTLYMQPALFSWHYAMSRMLTSWDIRPDLVFGHSIGEFAAAVTAGLMSFENAVSLVARRAALMEKETAEGTMIALRLSAEARTQLLDEYPALSLAAVNTLDRCTLSATVADMETVKAVLAARGISFKSLPVNRAFHSQTMDGIEAAFRAACPAASNGEPVCDMLSTLIGDLAGPGMLDADYWFRQLRQPVLFHDAVQRLGSLDVDRIIEIGPDGSFARLLRGQGLAQEIADIADGKKTTLADTVARLFRLGYDAPLADYYQPYATRLAELPAIVFTPTRCWPDTRHAAPDMQPADKGHRLLTALEPLWAVLRAQGESSFNLTFTTPLPLAALPEIQSNTRTFLGRGEIALALPENTLIARYSSGGSPTPDVLTGAGTSVADWMECAAKAGHAISTCWLSENWTLADTVHETCNQVVLTRQGNRVAQLTIAERTIDRPKGIELWTWRWQEVAKLYQQKLSHSAVATAESWLIVGTGEFADDLAAIARWTGHHVLHQPHPSGMRFDQVIDCRHLSIGGGFEESMRLLTTATEHALGWLDYAARHPACRITTVLCETWTMMGPASPLWAIMTLWRSLKNEHPHLAVTCIDISPATKAEEVFARADHLHDLGTALLLHNGKLMEPAIDSAPAVEDRIPIAWDTGLLTLIAGFGAVGQELAGWLSSQGCKALAIIMHRAVNAQQQACIDTLEAAGTRVNIIASKLDDASDLRAQIDALPLPVGRVFHTAHAGQSALLAEQDMGAFNRTIAVKVAGSLVLRAAVNNQPVDLFCLFSSAAALLAMPGAAYNVANAWQDAFAAHLRSEGFPALSIAWGQFAMDRRGDKLEQLGKTALKPIPADAGFAILNGLLKAGKSGLVPISIDPQALVAATGALPATRSLLRPLLAVQSQTATDEDGGVDLSLAGLAIADQQEKIAAYLLSVVRKRLKFADNSLDRARPLTEQGVDSLIFLELVHIINRQFDLQLPPTAGYAHPTINALAGHIRGLVDLNDDIDFSRPLGKGELTVVARPDDRFLPFPLTDLQQAFWIGRNGSMTMGNVSCHEYLELELENLDVANLEKAWNRLISRHEMMRCIILPTGQQRILETVPAFRIMERDLTTVSHVERQRTLGETRDRMSYQVFDASRWPLFELTVSHLPGGVSRVHLDMDLLVFDIQSFRVVFGELATLLENPDAILPELNLSFRDYVLAEHAQQNSEQWQKAKSFWLEKLDTFPSAPDLPLLRAPGDLVRPNFRTLDHRLSAASWVKFQARATALGLTPSGALLTAFTQVLSTYSKAPDFTLNITYFNRRNVHPQVMDICGDFTSLMLLPVGAREGEQFIEAAKRTQQDLWQALSHRDFNGIRLMRELGRHRNTGADGIDMPVVFTSMIGMDFDDPSRADWALTSRQVFQINQTPQVWLDYQATEYGGALVTRWFIADDLFEPRLIEDMFRTYTNFLSRLAEDEALWNALMPDLRTDEDKAFSARPTASREGTEKALMPDLFQRSAEMQPGKHAILSPQGDQSYEILQARVNALAHHLIEQGVKPSEPVAVVMAKQPDAIVAALAIQAAGACYVPVNGDYENERLLVILNDLRPFAVLTSGASPVLPADMMRIDLTGLALDHLPKHRPDARQSDEDLAYIIYTSGTTGQPKGAMLDHRGPINTLHALNRRLQVGESDRTLSLCAFHHDMSVFDIYAMMAVGGAVILPDRERSKDPMHWLELIEEHRPTIINAVPAFVSMLLDAQALRGTPLPAPRHIMMGGDWIALDLVRRINTLWPDCTVHSIGGPTETAIVSAYYRIETLEPDWKKVPYGRPLENQTCRILNPAGQECPPNIIGEICTGGRAMSLGYWRDETRTRERYRLHRQSGERLFHTGDLGRLDADGQIEIIGRLDNQLKINGMRIEPSEIESLLADHPAIAETAVVYGGAPLKQLHAYFTTGQETNAQAVETPLDNGWHRALTVGEWACNDLPEGFDLVTYGEHFANMELLSTWVMLETLQTAGFFRNPGDTATTAAMQTALRVAEMYRKLFQSWLDVLTADSYLIATGEGTFAATDRIRLVAGRRALGARIGRRAATGPDYDKRIWSLFERCIAQPQKLLSGEMNPLELMFEGGRTDFVESWYRENPVSRHFNTVAGETVRGLCEERSASEPLRILEFGAGIGSVTHDILSNIPHANFSYAFTDLSRYFLDNAAKTFADWPQMRFSIYDINRDPVLQGLDLASYDLVIGSNVLHDAANVNRSSRLIRSLLKPNGHLLLVEGTLNPRFQLVSLGFVEGLSHYEDERLATCLPMLSAERWQAVLHGAGFARHAPLPPKGSPVEKMNYHVIVAQNANTVAAVDHDALSGWLKEKLPDTMIPQRWHQLSAMPLTLNGKVDRMVLLQAIAKQAQPEQLADDPPSGETESRLAALWGEILDQDVISASANFFVLGGDSLLMTRLGSRIQHAFGAAPDLATLLRNPLLRAQAAIVETLKPAIPGPLDDEVGFETGVI